MDKDYFLKRLSVNRPTAHESVNYDLLPKTFLAHDLVPFECHQHGVFHQKAYSHLNGASCPECGKLKSADGRAVTTSDFVEKSKAKFGDRFSYLKTEYVRKEVELTITCHTHGDFTLKPFQHFRHKHGCPKCDFEIPRAIRRKKLLEKARQIHGDLYDYSKVSFPNLIEKVEIGCPIHGFFWQSFYHHTVTGSGCPSCNRDSDRLTLDDFVAKSRAIHGDSYDYSKVVYETNASKVVITCKKHGDFTQRAASHLAGNKCKKCFREEALLSTEKFIENARAIHGDAYDYSKVKYLGNKKPVEIVCSTHGSFWQTPNAHVSCQNGCRLCNESKGEKAVEFVLKKYAIEYVREYRLLPHRYRYDFYLPGFDIYIEFHGQQHYRPVGFFGGREGYLQTKERDIVKRRLVKDTGGTLITLSYLNLSDGSVEKELVHRLKRIYAKWYVINGKVMAFKALMDVFGHFNLPSGVHLKDLDAEVQKRVGDFKILF